MRKGDVLLRERGRLLAKWVDSLLECLQQT
jgi:hypothetical protein